MSDSYIQSLFSERIGGEKFGKEDKIYKFQKIKNAKKVALEKHPERERRDFGVGEPDDIAFDIVREELKVQVDLPENRWYADNGIDEFREAASIYMKKVFGVNLNPDTEITHSIGSKPGLAMFPLAFINPGDISILTVPGYPVLGNHTRFLGGEVVSLPLTKENDFFPDLDSIDKSKLERAKILVINYPNNPIGKGPTVDFFKKVVDFAKQNDLIVLQDAAYASLVFNGKPLSFLSIPGAMDVGVEFHSMSKAFNMTGWRMAYLCGNEKIIQAFRHIKDNCDSGQFRAIQKACIKALENPQLTDNMIEKYSRRFDRIIEILNSKGFKAEKPDGTFYLYTEAPKSIKGKAEFSSAEEFSEYLIKEKSISTVPWDETGNFVRFSMSFDTHAFGNSEQNVYNELSKRLDDCEFEF